jgi:hypothetical protein
MAFPRLGGFLTDITVIGRDANGARTDSMYPVSTGRIQLYVDGVPLIDSTVAEIWDDMAISYGLGVSNTAGVPGITRPAGVLSFSRRTSMAQTALGLLDTGESFLSSNPGTLIELNVTTAQSFTGPGTFSALIGQVVPSGALIQGLPEL